MRFSVRGIIEYKGTYLLVRVKVADGFWCLPGGGVDEGEDLLSALKRELIEETGVEPDIGNLLFVHQIQTSSGYTPPEFFFHIKNNSDYLEVDITKTSHGVQELEEIGFMRLGDIKLLPSFLEVELPELTKKSFDSPVRFRLSELETKF